MSFLSHSDFEKLRSEVEKIAKSEGVEVWDIEFKAENRGMVLRIYIDRKGGITIDQCADVSKQTSILLDAEDLIKDKYTLEVSSPGLDRKLVKREHFESYLEKRIKVQLKNEIVGRKKFRGILQALDGDKIIISDQDEHQEHSIRIGDIYVANLEIEI